MVVVAVVAMAAAACGSGGGDGATPSTTSPARTVALTTTTTPRVAGRITINFAGDISFEPPRAALLVDDPDAILGAIAPILGDADLTVANLETAVTGRGSPEPKAFTFRTTPDALDALRSGGIDVVSIANNHGLDYGPDGVPDALAASAAKEFPVIGIGNDEAEALEPYRTTIRGNRVAVVAATQVLDDDLIASWTATPDHPGLASAKRTEPFLAAVAALRDRVDTLVVFLHWGIERNDCPSEAQRELAHQLVDAGADIIVGGHAHRLQGAGRLDDAIVAYGLGNFAFYAGTPEAAETGVLRVSIGGGRSADYQWIPARIDGQGRPVPLEGPAAIDALAAWNGLRPCTGLDA